MVVLFSARCRGFSGVYFLQALRKLFFNMRRSRQEAPFACWRKDGESREMPRCCVVYQCKSGCFRCGRKSVVSPFVKTNGQLICRSCYCFEKRQSAESEEASTAVRSVNLPVTFPDTVTAAAAGVSRTVELEHENQLFVNLTGEDLKKEINQLEKAVFNAFIKEGKPSIYEPDQFYSFCKTGNAGNVFNFILSSISSDRHSKDRKELNRRRTVTILFQFVTAYRRITAFFLNFAT